VGLIQYHSRRSVDDLPELQAENTFGGDKPFGGGEFQLSVESG
jgi:hypothetical protein